MSIDALRGFDMFWIVGGDTFLQAFYKAWPILPFWILHEQMDHKAWAGLAFYDLIFPLFIFIVGVSVVFSLSRTLEQGSKGAAMKRILIRGALLYMFGLLIYGGISKGFDEIRWTGVLQRIAVCYVFSAVAFCLLKPRTIVFLCCFILGGYWAVTALVPIRDFRLQTAHLEHLQLDPASPATRDLFLATTSYVQGRYEDGLNVPNHADYLYLPGYKWDGAYDPEGLLSTFPALVTCMLGVLAGLYLRNSQDTDRRKVLVLFLAGLAAIGLGYFWSMEFPIIKKLWTSSYMLVAAGFSCLFLGCFHLLIEVWNWRRWCIPFVWLGMNAITIYVIWHVVDFPRLARLFVGGPVEAAFGRGGPLLVATGALALMFVLVRFLYKRNLFLRL